MSPGVYNWSADAAGVYFLKQAAAYNVPVLTAFVNSAPPAFTSNGQSCGGTLVDDQIPAFAQYLADVIAHFKEEGVVFTHVSPMNEPDNVSLVLIGEVDGYSTKFISCRALGMEIACVAKRA